MIEFNIQLADIPLHISCHYNSTKEYCKLFLTDEPPRFSVSVDEEDYRYEQRYFGEEQHTPQYLELLAVYRKICEQLSAYDVFLLHGSAIAVDGETYIFIAPSGTGKSTHTALWRKRLSEHHEVVMINDDKPLIQVKDETIYACGTPWNGAYHLSENIKLPVRAICILERAEENRIVRVEPAKAFPVLLRQSYRPPNAAILSRILGLLGEVRRRVSFYQLGCNLNPEAAEIAYQAMKEGD